MEIKKKYFSLKYGGSNNGKNQVKEKKLKNDIAKTTIDSAEQQILLKETNKQIIPYQLVVMKTEDGKKLIALYREQNIINNKKFTEQNNKIIKLEKALINHEHSINTSGPKFYTPYTVYHDNDDIYESDNIINMSNPKFNYKQTPNIPLAMSNKQNIRIRNGDNISNEILIKDDKQNRSNKIPIKGTK